MNHGEGLKSLGCTTSQLDVASEDAIRKFKEQYGDRPLDLLLNVAGMKASPTTGSGRDERDVGMDANNEGPRQEWLIRTTTHSPP